MYIDSLPARFSWYARSVHSSPMPSGRTSAATLSMAAIASPVLYPSATLPMISAAGYRLYRFTVSGPMIRLISATDPIGTRLPSADGTFRLYMSRSSRRLASSAWTDTL